MEKWIKNLLALFAILYATDAFSSDMEITTNPEGTEIFVVNPVTAEKVSIGQSPYKGPVQDLIQKAGGANVFMLEVTKDGFDPYRLLFSTLGSNDVSLKINLNVSNDIKLVQDFDLLVSDLFDVQRLARSRDFTSALQKIEMLEKKFPHFSIVHEMKGSIFYLSNEYTRALASYRKAFSLNAKNRDAYRMKSYLERRFNIDPNEMRGPAGAE